MDENRVAGTAKNIGGKVEEGFGRVTGDTKSQVEGIVNQATGAAQDLYGQAADTARDTALTSTNGSAIRSRRSRTPPRWLRSASAGSWGDCIVRSETEHYANGQIRTASGSTSKLQALPGSAGSTQRPVWHRRTKPA